MENDKRFLLLESNIMFCHTLSDLSQLENVVIYHKKKAFKNKIVNLLFNIHNSDKIRRYVDLPLRILWIKLLFDKLLKSFSPDYLIITVSWFSENLVNYFREKSPKCKIIYRFSDKVQNELGIDAENKIKRIKTIVDGILVYSQEDALKYNVIYHSMGCSIIDKEKLVPRKKFDVVFIGAEKGRLEKIRQAYNLFVSAGLSCFFYVLMVKKQDRRNDGIIYADRVMPFCEYLSYEVSARCLFEIVQDGTSGRTFRMMEAIMYDKLLITNCQEILDVGYYSPQYVQLYNDVANIDPTFIVNSGSVNYHYNGEFSPKRVLDFIKATW